MTNGFKTACVLLAGLGVSGLLAPARAQSSLVNKSDNKWYVWFKLDKSEAAGASIQVYYGEKTMNKSAKYPDLRKEIFDDTVFMELEKYKLGTATEPGTGFYTVLLKNFKNNKISKIIFELYDNVQKKKEDRSYVQLTGEISDDRLGFKKVTVDKVIVKKPQAVDKEEAVLPGSLFWEGQLAYGDTSITASDMSKRVKP